MQTGLATGDIAVDLVHTGLPQQHRLVYPDGDGLRVTKVIQAATLIVVLDHDGGGSIVPMMALVDSVDVGGIEYD